MTTKLQTHPKYKSSGIDWLGNIPVGWDIVPTRSLFKTKKQVVGSNAEKHLLLGLTLGGVKPRDLSLGGKNPADYDNYQIFEPGELVMCLFDYDVTPRTVGYVKQKGMMTGAYTRLIPRAKLEPRYYCYLFLYFDEKKELLHLCTGLRNSISKHVFWSLQNPLPPFENQKQIADYLDEKTKVIDELVMKKEKLVELLRAKRAALITRTITKGLDFNAKLKPSGIDWLGDIPVGWQIWPLKYALIQGSSDGSLIKGRLYSQYSNGLFPAFSASGQDVWVDVFQYNRPGIVLSAVGARCGKTFKANGKWTAIANTHVLFPRKGFERDYLWYMTDNEKFWERGGTAQPFVLVSKALARKRAFPPFEVQKQITDFLDAETAKIDKAVVLIESQIEKLKEYRSSLIYHAVTGKIKI